MKEVQVVAWDDKLLADGQRVEAKSTVLLAYNGTEVELDLSEESRGVLEDFILAWLRAGHRPEQPFPGTAKRRYKQYDYDGDTQWAESRRERQEMRAWADEQIAADPSLASRYNYITESGHYYHPRALKDDFQAWKRGRESAQAGR